MRKRYKMSRRGSRKHFRKHSGYNRRNVGHPVMRGGIRF